MNSLPTAVLALAFVIAVELVAVAGTFDGTITFKSPDKHLLVTVAPVRNPTLRTATESTISILSADGSPLSSHDFSSHSGDQGYVVDSVKWTPDSQYCVFRLRSSGGHSPMLAPIVFWSRRTNRFYSLQNYTADQVFSVAATTSRQTHGRTCNPRLCLSVRSRNPMFRSCSSWRKNRIYADNTVSRDTWWNCLTSNNNGISNAEFLQELLG